MASFTSSRRRILTGMTGLVGGTLLAGPAFAAPGTPWAAEGPFYPQPTMRLPDGDNDLVSITGQEGRAQGEILTLRGRLTDQGGQPLAGHRIEIWQCDANGIYRHPRAGNSGGHDPAFQGFGHDITDADGGYVFRTIKPAVYPGRTPHIHVKVLRDGQELLTTQFYIQDHPLNGRDFLFNRMTAAEADAVSMDLRPGEAGLAATVNMVV